MTQILGTTITTSYHWQYQDSSEWKDYSQSIMDRINGMKIGEHFTYNEPTNGGTYTVYRDTAKRNDGTIQVVRREEMGTVPPGVYEELKL